MPIEKFNMTNATNFVEVMEYANLITDDMFGIMMLVTIFFISFITMKSAGWRFEQVFSSSILITTVVSVFMSIMNLISTPYVYYLVFMTSISIMFLYWGSRNVAGQT